MKTIVIISTMRFVNNNSAGVNRMQKYARIFISKGVRVIFASLLEFNQDATLLELFPGTLTFYSPRSSNTNFKDQKYKIINFLKTLTKNVNYEKNVLFLVYPSTYNLFDVLVVLYLKIIKGYRVFFEANEVRKYTIRSKGPYGILKYISYSLSEIFLYFYNGIICISESIEKYYSNYNKKNIRIPILTDSSSEVVLKYFYSQNEAFNIALAGTIDVEKENLKVFLLSIRILSDRGYKIKFNLFGKVSDLEKSKLYHLIKMLNLNSVVVLCGEVPYDKLQDKLQENNLLVLPRKPTKQNQLGFSTKLSDYIQACVPVLLTDVSDNLKYIEASVSGIVADYNSEFDFADKISYLIDNYNSLAPTITKNANEVAMSHFHFSNYTSKLYDFLFNE
ncbi:glycosyltransferase [Perlabentimonas gracilis]|uniref:glycosyltransferase n=1 Tax=Perlabentimonas gracilis TaxID=2715279 RepID=UPI001409DCA3|nr:glycosyltransferase [Perlabentimonas gracilis]NHB70198.1 glycosyltransferase [Perlabentimonas gracilis]